MLLPDDEGMGPRMVQLWCECPRCGSDVLADLPPDIEGQERTTCECGAVLIVTVATRWEDPPEERHMGWDADVAEE